MHAWTSRRVMTWIAVPLIVTQFGCAARGVRVPAGESPAGITEADRKACEDYAGKHKTKSVAGLRVLGLLAIPISIGLAGASLAMLRPDGLRVLPAGPAILNQASENAKTNQAVRAAAVQACLEPLELAQTEGPDHPRLAQSLATLARGYVAIGDPTHAEPLFQRALAIQETALGPGHPDTRATRQSFAELLRKAHRDQDAETLEARNQAFAAPPDPSPVPEGAAEEGRSAGVAGTGSPELGAPEAPVQAVE